MRKFSLRSLMTCCIGIGAFVFVLVVFSNKPTVLNTLNSGNLAALPLNDSDELFLTLDEGVSSLQTTESLTDENSPTATDPFFKVKVKRGDSLSSIFQRVRIPQEDLLAIQRVCPEEWGDQYLD
ncbi:MAG: LysM peptidoglycan-binding domain-containing protein, partial [Gammaproteobacteria bacterium]|nr:LysM peptidoglycan-binding domain-containing protein [Gammaproteobacteria bacterium]